MSNAVDVHSHILFSVDDGSQSMEETGAMLNEAKRMGISHIIATPHVYSLGVSTSAIKETYEHVVQEYAVSMGLGLRLGYECNYRVMLQAEPEQMLAYTIQNTNVLLIEPPNKYLPQSWENRLTALQQHGMDIVIAHPERCEAFQQDILRAKRMLEIGCELQISAGSLFESVLSKTKKCAQSLLKSGFVTYIASDAHCVRDYKAYAKASRQYGKMLRKAGLLTER